MSTPGTPPVPHVGGPILPPCCPVVLTGNLAQARVSDMATCVGPPDVITRGAATVLVRGLPAARLTDTTAHGGVIVTGETTVLINGPLFQARPITLVFDPATGQWVYQYGSSIRITPHPGDPTYQSRAIAALVRLETTPNFQAALADLEGSGHTITIVPYSLNTPAGWGPYNAFCQAQNGAGASTPGVGSNSTVGWDPDVNGFGPPGTTPNSSQPGSDIILGHEVIHGVHNATGSYPGGGPTDYNGINVPEDRNTVGLPASTYNHPTNADGSADPLHGTALPDTTAQPYTENGLRSDYANSGIPSPVTGQPPEQRPSYYPPTATGGAGSPW